MGDAEARMLAALNGLILGFLAAVAVLNGLFGVPFVALAALSLAFWISTWCAGRRELRPLIATWLALIGCFVWSLQDESFGLFEGGAVFLLIAAYLAIGLIVSVILYRETAAKKRAQAGERSGRERREPR
jgi:hypothetical protein